MHTDETNEGSTKELLAEAIALLEQWQGRWMEMRDHRDQWRRWALDWHGEFPNMEPPPPVKLECER